ncbi:hypothetical protein C0J52_14684 [Blattella germanica]|nr:hypothetical protein C0J52_14684 [Blattella germanica]
MSPFRRVAEDFAAVPAYSVYRSEKQRKQSNKGKNKALHTEEIIITEDDGSEIQEVINEPSSSGVSDGKKKRKNRNQPGVEIIDIDENSDDSASTLEFGKRRKKNNKKIGSVKQNGTSPSIQSSNPSKKKQKNLSDVVSIIDSDEEDEDTYSGDSIVEAKKLFSWLITPVKIDEFFSDAWEKRPLHIKRAVKDYYTPVLSTAVIDRMLRNNNVQFKKNLDVTTYVDGKRETHNPDGRALPSLVWDYYKNGCSVRMINPQTFIPKLALLTTSLQDFLGSFCGANFYLTPPDSQGFAPHYDDIEAFILQVEGKKKWRLYAPKSDSEILPRFSSEDFSQEELGKLMLEVTLEPGDLLYFPRGTVHQATTVPGTHSLHITLSCHQRNTWGDLLEKRTSFLNKIRSLTERLFDHAPIDAAVDQMGKQFMHDAMPPILTAEEKTCTAFGDGYKMEDNGKLRNCGEFFLHTKIKLLRAHILRLVEEEDSVRLYHCVDNSLEYHGFEPQFLEIPEKMAPAVKHLIRSYPEFIKISDLPSLTDEEKIRIIGDLWDRGLVLTEKPLKKMN